MNKRIKKSIFVTFKKEGIHCYPAAGTDPNLKTNDEYDVSFLQFPHRHLFWFKVQIMVKHDDREIEFIQFKRWLESLYEASTLSLNHKSCEMIADELFEQINSKYPNRDTIIEVSEDGENGAIIEVSLPSILH
jgi:hypothetical protein